MVNEESGNRPRLAVRPIYLSWWQRAILGVAGLSLGAIGARGHIISGLDCAGTVSFVVTGSLSGALGVIGRFPNRISGKDYSAEFEERVEEAAHEKAIEVVQQAVDELPKSVKESIAESSLSISGGIVGAIGDSNNVTMAAADSLAFEARIAAALEKAAVIFGLQICQQLKTGKYVWDFGAEHEVELLELT